MKKPKKKYVQDAQEVARLHTRQELRVIRRVCKLALKLKK